LLQQVKTLKQHTIMKKVFSIILLSFLFASMQAENHPNALGIRSLSGGFGLGGELSYQRALSDRNRLELDLGWSRGSGNNFGIENRTSFSVLTGVYQWVNEIGSGFDWFYGLGGQVITYNTAFSSGFSLGLGGQVGVEYDFNELNVPFQASLDFRPMGILGGISGFNIGTALSLRYTF
jgi:hypothetical protein